MIWFIVFLAVATAVNAVVWATSSVEERNRYTPNTASISHALGTYAFLLIVAFVAYCTIGR